MEKIFWTYKIVVRYILFQIPAFLGVGFIVFILDHWFDLDPLLICLVLFAWIIKDIVLFPFVWKAYDRWDNGKKNPMIGLRGIALDTMKPKGYVRVKGELWQAELINAEDFVTKGDEITVVDHRGLTLFVQKDEPVKD